MQNNTIFPHIAPNANLALQLNVRDNGRDVAIIDVEGELDVYTSPRFRIAFLEIISRGYDYVVINLTHLRHIDSSGLSAILTGLKRIRERNSHGGIAIVCPLAAIKRIFEMTHLHRVTSLHESEDQALAAVFPMNLE